MKRSLIPLSIMVGTLAASSMALADHNSKNGEGWANMPNDIHNTRIETKEANDNEAFRDFVKYGEGSTSVNRFATDETQPGRAMNQQGKAEQVQNKSESKAQNQIRNENKVATSTQTQTKVQDRSRIHKDSSMTSQRGRDMSSTRAAGRSKGRGGKR